MDKEALRKQLYEELHSQFESRLRDAKRQKAQVEEELESVSEKWRSERRRLNSEIDRLESSVAEARDTRRKTSDNKAGRAVDAQEIAKIQAAAEEKLTVATLEWQEERVKLEGEVGRLQRGIAELLERSNNPLRANQLVKEQLEAKTEDALRGKRQAEEHLIAAKAEWEQEKLKIAAEMVRLRRSLGQTVKGKLPEEERAEELEKQLKESSHKREALEASLEKARKEISHLQERHAGEVEKITAQLDHSQKDRDSIESDLERVRRDAAKARDAHAAELKKTAAQIEKSDAARETLESDLDRHRKEAAKAKDSYAAEVKKMTAHLDEVSKARGSVEADLDKLRKETSRSRDTHSEEIQKLTAQLDEGARARASLASELEGLRKETAKSKDTHAADLKRLSTEFNESTQRHDSLQSELEKARQELSRLKETHAAEATKLTAQLEEARTELRNLSAAAEAADGAGKADSEDLQKQLKSSTRMQEALQGDLERMRLEGAKLQQTYSMEVKRLKSLLDDSKTEVNQLERRLTETKDSVSTEVVEQLRHQYDEKIQDMIRQKTQLSEELQNVSSLLESERGRFAAAASSTPAKKGKGSAEAEGKVDPETIDAEVRRVQEMIAKIASLIDDPNTELSTVIRKNVERAELDAYMKGILFTLGRSRGL